MFKILRKKRGLKHLTFLMEGFSINKLAIRLKVSTESIKLKNTLLQSLYKLVRKNFYTDLLIDRILYKKLKTLCRLHCILYT